MKHIALALFLTLLSCSTKSKHPFNQEGVITKVKTDHTITANPPMMGWASWNNYRIHINEAIVKAQTDALISNKLHELGYSYINIDDGFFGGRDQEGLLLAHKDRFPAGMKSLSEYIHSKGLKSGIYSDAGINTCASYWDKDTIGAGMGLYGHDKIDLTRYLKEWNYDFIKIDWCGADWLGLDEQTRYTELSELIQSIKPGTKFNVCRWKFPGKWVTQIADSWRISGDIGDTFESIMRIIDHNADLWMYASEGHYNDMDILQVGRGMSYEEDKTHFSMWCLMHSPLILGNDLTQMNRQTLEIISNKELIAINQSPYVYQARRILDYGDLEVWARPLISTMSGEVVVALLNRSDSDHTIAFDIKSVGLDSSLPYSVKDLWSKEFKSTSNETKISRTVPSHGIVVLKIKGKSIPFNTFQFKDKN